MAEYRLIQISESKSSKPPQYQLLCDDHILKDSCTYVEGIEYVWSIMKPEDTFQEKDINSPSSTKTSYEEMMKQRALDIAFEQGRLH